MLEGVRPGFAIWLTGLPSSGKTTLAYVLKDSLSRRCITVQILDTDELRRVLTPHPTYSDEERDWFYGVVAFMAELFTENGVHVLIAATAVRRSYRESARARTKRFAEVYLECSPDVCRSRDPKGLWKQAEAGEIDALPGVGVPYETPPSPEVCVNTMRLSAEEAGSLILSELDKHGFFSARDRWI